MATQTSETIRKHNLLAEIIILVQSLNEAGGGASSLTAPSQDDAEKMTLSELEGMKREFRDLARTLGGVKGG
jgi:hypothetical protein